jgi:hypothetical protein
MSKEQAIMRTIATRDMKRAAAACAIYIVHPDPRIALPVIPGLRSAAAKFHLFLEFIEGLGFVASAQGVNAMFAIHHMMPVFNREHFGIHFLGMIPEFQNRNMKAVRR